MSAHKFRCWVTEKTWLTPTVFRLRFDTLKKIKFQPGQFISLVIPSENPKKPIRRLYSFANSPELAAQEGYELCIKYVPNGVGTNYLASLEKGSDFMVTAPHGDFLFEPKSNKSICLICTSSGVAPLKSIAQSALFQEAATNKITCIFGARSESEILYPGLFESLGIQVVHALSNPSANWTGFRGRITDYLSQLPITWPWHSTEFYICGNGNMIRDTRSILREGHGVSEKSIHQEAYFVGDSDKAPKKAA